MLGRIVPVLVIGTNKHTTHILCTQTKKKYETHFRLKVEYYNHNTQFSD